MKVAGVLTHIETDIGTRPRNSWAAGEVVPAVKAPGPVLLNWYIGTEKPGSVDHEPSEPPLMARLLADTEKSVTVSPEPSVNFHQPTGVGMLEVKVYVAEATALLPCPEPTAMAFTVVVAEIVMGPVYNVELVVGVEPSVV